MKETSWVQVAPDSDFSIHNIPFGVVRLADGSCTVASIIGEQVINLTALYDKGYFSTLAVPREVLTQTSLNSFIALGKTVTRAVRMRIIELLTPGNEAAKAATQFLIPVSAVQPLLPVQIGDYTDFYSSKEHATNVGMMFRDPANALLPNWLHLPVGYHGRASSIVVTGTPLHRPKGQYKLPDEAAPRFGESRQLDFELEMGFVIGKDTTLGSSISTDEANEYIFGMALFNDWSARDIQAWEYVPLGPFLGKNFASTLSPWIVTLEALQPFRTAAPEQSPVPLPYLAEADRYTYDIQLAVDIQPAGGDATTICESNFKYLYWTMPQQLAHHTINGCNVRVGDLYASGTISGNEPTSYGSMLELTWRGTKPLTLQDGSSRKFIADNDTVRLRGWCEKEGVRVGFGECTGVVLPATPSPC